MRIISKKKLRDFWEIHASAKKPLEAWYKRTLEADWSSFQDLTRDVPSADIVGDCVVFNILHNDYRLIARVRFPTHLVYVLKIMTHADYDRSDWQTECGCFTPPPKPPKRRPSLRRPNIQGERRHAANQGSRRRAR